MSGLSSPEIPGASEKGKEVFSYQQLRPFVWAALGWFIVGTAIVLGFVAPDLRGSAAGWWTALFALSVLDLTAIAGLVGALVAGAPEGDRVRWGIRLLFLGVLKLGAWGVFAALLFGNRGIPNASLLSGLGTLIVVPLFGGFLWTFSNPKSA